MWALVESGSVTRTQAEVPNAIRLSDGRPVTGFSNLDTAGRISHGWYPVVTTQDTFDPATEILDDPQYTVVTGVEVQEHFPKRNLTVQELQDIADAQARAQRAADARAKPDASPVTWGDLKALLIDNGLI